ncbi:MAG: D-tyrosyl-tRNA(Tyr) deacylase [Nanoarchaeota archaeon]|nr:D-tyrosyl-tRNA(Tyr) deacylase [Nanoarchaeota archaeon]
MRAIIVSKKDIAGMNIKECLLRLFDFKEINEEFEEEKVYEILVEREKIKLYTTKKESINCENIDEKIDADFIVFATKHQSKSGIASLSVHIQGNWSKAEFGGSDRKLCIADADYLRDCLFRIKELASNNKYEIIQECTHHGPYLAKTPCMFIEIGSSEKQWPDKEAGEIIAETIMSIIPKTPKHYKTAFGIGGLHHCPNFTKVMEKSDLAFGHICPKYMLNNLNKEIITQAIERNTHECEEVILDWKGLSQYKQKITKMLDELKIKYKKTKEISS